MVESGTELAARLEDVISSLRAIVTAVEAGDTGRLAELGKDTRIAGDRFESELGERSDSCGPLFFSAFADWDGAEDEPADGLPAGLRLSVQVREDFVLVDEAAFHDSAARILAAHGEPAHELGEDGPMGELMALVGRSAWRS